MKCEKSTGFIDALLLGELSVGQWAKLAAHLKTCAACRHYYDRAVIVLRQLSGRSNEVCDEELARFGTFAIDAAIPAPPRWRWPWAVGALVAASLAGVVAMVVVPRTDAGHVAPRGDSAAVDIALRAYCVREAAGRLEVVSASTGEPPQVLCATGELLQFAYTLRHAEPVYLRIVGHTAQGEVLDYFPPSGSDGRLEVTTGEAPIPGSIRLKLRHQPGTVRVLAFASPAPLEPALAERHARGAAPPAGVRSMALTLQVLP